MGSTANGRIYLSDGQKTKEKNNSYEIPYHNIQNCFTKQSSGLQGNAISIKENPIALANTWGRGGEKGGGSVIWWHAILVTT